MAYSGDPDFPEGVLEAALEEEEWFVVTDRVPIGNTESGAPGADFTPPSTRSWWRTARTGFGYEVKTRSGKVAAGCEVNFSVGNVGRLAGITTGLLKAYPDSRRTWVDLIDSSHFPYEQASGVAWFDRADALDHVAQVVARHGLRREIRGPSPAVRA